MEQHSTSFAKNISDERQHPQADVRLCTCTCAQQMRIPSLDTVTPAAGIKQSYPLIHAGLVRRTLQFSCFSCQALTLCLNSIVCPTAHRLPPSRPGTQIQASTSAAQFKSLLGAAPVGTCAQCWPTQGQGRQAGPSEQPPPGPWCLCLETAHAAPLSRPPTQRARSVAQRTTTSVV